MKLNASKRIRVAQTIKMGENINPGEGAAILHKAQQRLQEPGVKVIPLGTKEGIEMIAFYPNPCFVYLYVALRDDGKLVGVTVISHFHNTVDAIYLDKAYRGDGLGVAMYLGALHVLKEIRSSVELGIMAVRTWQKLSRYATVEMMDWDERKYIPFTWGGNGIPVIDGLPMNAGANKNREFIFTAKGR